MIIEKEYPCKEGNNYNKSYFNIIIENSTSVYLKNKKHLLFTFCKDSFDNKKYFPIFQKCSNTPILTSQNRKIASKGTGGKRTPTGIMGFFDRLTPQHKNLLGGINEGARETLFNRKCKKQWDEILPLYQEIDKIYKKIAPHCYKKSKEEYNKIHENLRIPKTTFTTITLNRNWRTSTHTDKGDFSKGLSCIVCLGNNKYTGGYLGFPKQKVLVKMEPGDIIFMDSHQPHCNTELNIKKGGSRISLVCYIREDMKKYHNLVEIEGKKFYLTKEDKKRFDKNHNLR